MGTSVEAKTYDIALVRETIAYMASASCPGATPDQAFTDLARGVNTELSDDTDAPPSVTFSQIAGKIRTVADRIHGLRRGSIDTFLEALHNQIDNPA